MMRRHPRNEKRQIASAPLLRNRSKDREGTLPYVRSDTKKNGPGDGGETIDAKLSTERH